MKTKMQMFASRILALSGLAFGMPELSRADDVDCPPNLGNVTIDGNVLVTSGTCQLQGTRVIGNVHVYPGGLLVVNGASIDGSIQAEGAIDVLVDQSSVNGSIQLDNLVGELSSITRSAVGGSIQLVSNRSELVVDDNDVNADVQAFGNGGGVDITNNVIDGNLQCKSNQPAPTGGFNRVAGNKEDQCANLQLAPVAGGGEVDILAAGVPAGSGGGAAVGLELLLALGALLVPGGRRRLGAAAA